MDMLSGTMSPTRIGKREPWRSTRPMIDRVDQGVGEIVKSLKNTGQFDNTLVLFLSDNGASPERPGVPGFDRYSETRDGKKVTYFGAGKPRDMLPGGELTCAGIGARWANVANTPFRYWKGNQHEGGIRTPLIVHWPQGLTTTAGTITQQDGHVMDIAATCLERRKRSLPEHLSRPRNHAPGRQKPHPCFQEQTTYAAFADIF